MTKILNHNYTGLALAVLILAAVHVVLSAIYMIVACKDKHFKQCGAWLVSLLVVVAILVLSAIATGQKENYDILDLESSPAQTRPQYQIPPAFRTNVPLQSITPYVPSYVPPYMPQFIQPTRTTLF